MPGVAAPGAPVGAAGTCAPGAARACRAFPPLIGTPPPPYAQVICEAFAVQTSDGEWHTTPVAALQAGGTVLSLTVSGVRAGLTAVASRGMFADWPLAQLFDATGTFPVVPWLANVDADSAVVCC